MEIKKAQFDQKPSLVEFEGEIVRINFDIEESTVVLNKEGEAEAEDAEPATRVIYLAHVIRVGHPLSLENIKEAVKELGFDEFKSEAVAAEALLFLAQNGNAVGDPVELAKRLVTAKIDAYDQSDAVNQFIFNGVPMWLDKSTRNGLIARINAEKSMGKEETTLWLGTQPFTLGTTECLDILNSLEVYASECFDKTAEHKSIILGLVDVESILAYDYKAGYPTSPSFN